MVVQARDIAAHLQQIGTWVDWSRTVDTFKAGDPGTPVRGIAVGWQATMAALEQAQAQGCNLFITHEPTFYSHRDDERDWLATEAAQRKQAFLRDTGMVVYRCHDVWDRVSGCGILDAWAAYLGLGQPLARSSYHSVHAMSHTTAWELADRVLAQLAPLGQQDIHVFGPKWRMVSRLGLGTGAITQVREMLALGADCLLVTDDGIATWREGAWAQDAGVPLIVVNHAVAELPGIRGLAQHLRERFLDVPVTLVAEACGYEILANERQRDDGVRMRRDTLDDLPPVVVPKGYSLRPMAADEAWAYVQVMNRSNLGGRGDAGWFERTYASDPAYDSSFLQLIWKGDRPVAAAGAWHNTLDGEPWGMIHWVGVDQDARGRGLGKAVTLAALHRLRERGFERAFLGTHAWRLPAIAAYQRLGFRPWPHDPPIVYVGGQARWDQIARDLDTWRAGR